MPATLRELRQRKRSVQSTQKITRAMELIAASRITRAMQEAARTLPYQQALNRAVRNLYIHAPAEHPLAQQPTMNRRTALLVVTSDRGLAGAYSTNVIRKAEETLQMLAEEGRETRVYMVGRKGIAYFTFNGIKLERTWAGISDKPDRDVSDQIANELMSAFTLPYEQGGVDEVQAVYTRFQTMLDLELHVRTMLPLKVVAEQVEQVEHIVDEAPGALEPEVLFDEDSYDVLDYLLPMYVRNRVHFYLMEAAASELASKEKAMKAATDNAETLVGALTRQINQARQGQITQEITEIVGGAQALSEGQGARS